MNACCRSRGPGNAISARAYTYRAKAGRRFLAFMLIGAALAGFSAVASNVCAEDEIPRILKEEARERLDDPEVIFIDVRLESNWQSSRFKIRGAVREDPDKTGQWLDAYEPDRTYILYCK